MNTRQKTQAGQHLTQMLTDAYTRLHERASQKAFCVWIAINVPAEIFSGFDHMVYAVPESHAALCAGKGIGDRMCEKAENIGYSPDLCAYARIDIGNASDRGRESPTLGLPKPDLLVSNTNNCALLTKWFDVHHRQWGVPHFILDVPFCYGPQQEKDFRYIVRQIRDLIRYIEKLSGQRFNAEGFDAAVRHSWEGLAQWKRFLALARHRPSPITAFDSFVHMAPFLICRGTPALKTHYAILTEEAERKLETGNLPVPNEEFRLFWDNIAPWHQLRRMSERLARLDANIVGASYTSCMGSVEGSFDLHTWDGQKPLEYIARTMNAYMCPHGMDLRFNAMAGAVADLSVDGVVFASNQSCKPYSITQMDQQRRLKERLGIDSVMISVDHADVRKYSEENAFIRIETLLEMIRTRRHSPSRVN